MLVVVNKALLWGLVQLTKSWALEFIMIGYWGSLLELDAWNVMNAIICDDIFLRLYSWVLLYFQRTGLFIMLKFGMLQQEESDVGLPGGNGQLITLGLGLLATALAAAYVTKLAQVMPLRAIFLYLNVWILMLLERTKICLCPNDKRELALTLISWGISWESELTGHVLILSLPDPHACILTGRTCSEFLAKRILNFFFFFC